MRLAICTETFIPQVNGVARTIAKLAEHLTTVNTPATARVEILVIAPDTGSLPQPLPYQLHPVAGVDFPVYPELKIPLPNYGEIAKKLKQFQPDLIHLVTPFVIGLCGLKYAKDQQIPLVASYHTNIPQYLKYYNSRLFNRILWHFLRWVHNQCQVNYCPSQDTLKLLNNRGIRHLEIWDRGIDCTEFNPRYRNEQLRNHLAKGKETLLLYVGRLAQEKDLDILMKAMQRLRWQTDNVQLVLVGDGPMAPSLKKNAPDNVTFTGYKHGRELAEIYASGDIFVFPSTTETFGNVVLEAMASGLPVIAALAGGVKENLINDYNGLGCKPRNSGDMTNAIIKLIKDKTYRQQLSGQAREYALTKSWDAVFNQLLNSYQKAMAGDPLSSSKRQTG